MNEVKILAAENHGEITKFWNSYASMLIVESATYSNQLLIEHPKVELTPVQLKDMFYLEEEDGIATPTMITLSLS